MITHAASLKTLYCFIEPLPSGRFFCVYLLLLRKDYDIIIRSNYPGRDSYEIIHCGDFELLHDAFIAFRSCGQGDCGKNSALFEFFRQGQRYC